MKICENTIYLEEKGICAICNLIRGEFIVK